MRQTQGRQQFLFFRSHPFPLRGRLVAKAFEMQNAVNDVERQFVKRLHAAPLRFLLRSLRRDGELGFAVAQIEGDDIRHGVVVAEISVQAAQCAIVDKHEGKPSSRSARTQGLLPQPAHGS